ncbi:MAG TPA: ABC transporter substrate-binding protein [Polyangiaceae bacterium]|nr:ABC transporter substrate-binding protein [Polyangiaceae bacterium]
MMKKLVTALALSVASLLIASGVWAGEATQVVKDNQARMFAIIAKPKSAAQQKQLREMFDRFLEYDTFAERSMGKKWKTLDAAQKKEFTDLLTQLIRNNYKRNLTKLLDFDIRYEAEQAKKDGVLVNSVATHKKDKREPPFELDFLMAKRGGKMKIIDIITEGASMTKTYRAQFLRILRKDGYDKLIQKMKDKLAKDEG